MLTAGGPKSPAREQRQYREQRRREVAVHPVFGQQFLPFVDTPLVGE